MKIKDGFVLTKVGDDYVVVPTGTAAEGFHGIIRLNDTCAFIWRSINEGLSAEQIAERMIKEYSVDLQTASKCTNEIIEKLRSDGIIVE